MWLFKLKLKLVRIKRNEQCCFSFALDTRQVPPCLVWPVAALVGSADGCPSSQEVLLDWACSDPVG